MGDLGWAIHLYERTLAERERERVPGGDHPDRWILLVKPPRYRPSPRLPHHLHELADEALPRSFGLR
jgi:hypothetical protein